MSKKGLRVGDRVLLCHEMVQGIQGRAIPIGTVGTVIGLGNGVPQVDFGQYGIKNCPPHALTLLDAPDGAPEPEDGDDLVSIVAYLTLENARLRQQIQRPLEFGRS